MSAAGAHPFPSSAYQRLPSWVLGFHGCDRAVGLKLLSDAATPLHKSRNSWDWLGDGMYFWENDPERAWQFANKGLDGKVSNGRIKDPFVIGAVIDLGRCCNLFDQAGVLELKAAHDDLLAVAAKAGQVPPANKGPRRMLDKAVIDHMHTLIDALGDQAYDTVRGPFFEGGPLYPGTEICAETHIQIAVRTPAMLKGYFLPRNVPELAPMFSTGRRWP